jgi:RNA polymerase sigma factor (sigma-70 family)
MDFFTFDDEYVRRLREGDPATVKHYVEYFTPLLKARLRGRVSPNDVDDAIQDVHQRVLTNLKNGKPIQNLGPYVFGICNNVMKEYLRRDRHMEPLPDDDPPAPPAVDQRQRLIEKQRNERVIAVLAALAVDHPHDAEILTDIFLREMDRNAICRKHNITRANLRVLLCRALKKFRGKYGDPDDS